jgi:murein L,D-transpeptidase YcbB/YkuD
MGDSSSVAPPTGFSAVTSVFVGVYDNTGLALTNPYSNAITVTIVSTNIRAGDVVQGDVNGVWQIIPTAAVVNGEATVLLTSGEPVEVTLPPVKIPTTTPASKIGKNIHEPNLQFGSIGSAVRLLQGILDKDGAKLVVDGIFGPLTEAAVKAFQSAHHLPADGIVGPATWRDLL